MTEAEFLDEAEALTRKGDLISLIDLYRSRENESLIYKQIRIRLEKFLELTRE
jgi:hypothetical protein